MQAILTKYHGPTNTRGARISARCQRGRISVSYNSEWNDEENHKHAACVLCDRFGKEDYVRYGSPQTDNPWLRPFVTGCLPSGDFCHVFVEGGGK